MHTKDYLNNEIKEEIEKKGFSIYNYISLKELLLTVNKDYLAVITALNIPFMIIFVVIGFLSYTSDNYEYFGYMFIFIYSLIFTYLIAKLSFRTYKFSQITNILYTKKGLIIGEKLFHYQTDTNLKNLLLDYDKLFDEYLSKPSRLSKNISILRTKLTSKLAENYSTLSKAKDVDNRVVLGLFVLLTIYSISIFIFYFVGIAFGFVLFFIFSFFINLYFKTHKSVELKIKDNMTIIDDKLKKLDEIYLLLKQKIDTFQDGEISNLSNKIDKELNQFYENINIILTHKDTLKTIIEQSIYKDFIDFEYLAFYIKTQFNKPLSDVINLMSDYKSKVDNQIKDIENHLKTSNEKENYQVEQKLINLQTIQKNISLYLNKLKMSLQ